MERPLPLRRRGSHEVAKESRYQQQEETILSTHKVAWFSNVLDARRFLDQGPYAISKDIHPRLDPVSPATNA